MIPLILWQTWKTKTLPSELKKYYSSWDKSNPKLEKFVIDDKEAEEFIKNNFDESVYNLYMSFPNPINRADFWRIAQIYITGGIYADLDITCNKRLDTFIDMNVDAFFIKDLDNIGNFFFGAEPKHPILKMTLDKMIKEGKYISNKNSQDWGMHHLHETVREYYNVKGTDFPDNVLIYQDLSNKNILIHHTASVLPLQEYPSWREIEKELQLERDKGEDILFFTTFNKNGYELYGKEWIKTFIKTTNIYPSFKARIYYEGFKPQEEHPNIEWVDYHKTIPYQKKWVEEYKERTTHADYVKTMTVRFSFKAFVVQHALQNSNHKYTIWLDGDCLYLNDSFAEFPKKLLDGGKFGAFQIEHAHDLHHVESGILIFETEHPETKKWHQEFIKNYKVENVLSMGEPYDGFIVYKSLLTSGVKNYVNLNEVYGKGGIQSDPGATFLHPEIVTRFYHNIGWTGKNQYDSWEIVLRKDEVYQRMETALFGQRLANKVKKENAMNKLEKLRKLQRV